jgi:hypothetical protein
MGTGVVQDLGGDLTGKPAISHVGDAPEDVAAVQAMRERVFATAQPVFATGQYQTLSGSIHNSSVVLLPLSDDGTHANMIIFTRVACFCCDVRSSRNWLQGARMKLGDVIDICGAAGLEKCRLDWQGICLASTAAS